MEAYKERREGKRLLTRGEGERARASRRRKSAAAQR